MIVTGWAGHALLGEGQPGRTEAVVGCGLSGTLDDPNEASGDCEYSSGAVPSEQWEFLQAC